MSMSAARSCSSDAYQMTGRRQGRCRLERRPGAIRWALCCNLRVLLFCVCGPRPPTSRRPSSFNFQILYSLYFYGHLPPPLLSSAFCPFQSFKIGITLPSLRCIPLCLDTPPGRLEDGKAMCQTESGGEDALQDGCTNALRGKISEGRGLPNWFAIGDINQGQLTTTTESGCKGLS